MVQEINVTIRIVTGRIAINEITALIGIEPTHTSRQRVRGVPESEQKMVWRLHPPDNCPKTSVLSAWGGISKKLLKETVTLREMTELCEKYIDITVIADGGYDDVTIPASLFEFAEQAIFQIVLDYYRKDS